MEYILVPLAVGLIIIAWLVIWLFSPRNDDDGELEELSGVVNVRRNSIENKQYPDDYSERVREGFND